MISIPRELIHLIARFVPRPTLFFLRVNSAIWHCYYNDPLAQLPALAMAQGCSFGRIWLQNNPPRVLDDMRTKEVVPDFYKFNARYMALSFDGKLLLLGNKSQTSLISTSTMKDIGNAMIPGGKAACFSRSGVYCAISSQIVIYVVNVETMVLHSVINLTIQHLQYHVAFRDNDKHIVTITSSKVLLWQASTVCRFYDAADTIYCLDTGPILIVIGSTGQVKIYPDNETLYTGHTHPIAVVAINTTETLIAAYSYGTIHLWNWPDGTHYTLPNPKQNLYYNHVAFNNLDQLLIRSSNYEAITIVVGETIIATMVMNGFYVIAGHANVIYCLDNCGNVGRFTLWGKR